jgi:hypothetical protein
MPCSSCNEPKIVARGLCGGCYHRLRRNGSIVRKNVQNGGKKCAAVNCTEDAYAKGFCHVHYDRQHHPLRQTWKNIRSRYPGETPKRWDRFEAFLTDVGEKPSRRYQLRRIDENKPYSAANVRWNDPVSSIDGYSKEDRQKYARNWRLKTKYGLTRESYNAMLTAQNGGCAICKQVLTMHVDHCHSTGLVRGLLCVNCNRMLGYAKDRPELLTRAAAYLARSLK